MKNRLQEVKKEIVEDLVLEEKPKQPKQGLSGKQHCICIDCDIFGCNPECYVCIKDFGEI